MPDYKTVDGVEYKQCCNSYCRKWYPATRKNFHHNKSRPDGLTAACKWCRNKLARERWDIQHELVRNLIPIDAKKVLAATKKNDRRIKSKRLASIDCAFHCIVCGYGYESWDKAVGCCNGRNESTLPMQNTPISTPYLKTYRINLRGGR